MKVQYFFSPSVSDKETYNDLNEEITVPGEGLLLSEKTLKDYCDIANDILTKAEKQFPDFAQDTGTEINVYFVDNEMIHEVNKDERGVDSATDVLSFPFLEMKEGDGYFDEFDLNPDNGAIMLGEIMVSVEKLKEQAEEYGHGVRRELAFLLCHGFLHLMGYDHIKKEDEEKMFPLTEKILDENGYKR